MRVPKFPHRIVDRLVVSRIGAETLIYNERSHEAFCLDPLIGAVWERCNGQRSVPDLSIAASADVGLPVCENAVLLSLVELQRRRLLQADSSENEATLYVSRRKALRSLSMGAAVAIPVIAAIIAPEAAQAYNGCVNCPNVPASRSRAEEIYRQSQGDVK